MRERITGLSAVLLLALVRALLPARGRHRAVRTGLTVGQSPSAPAAATSASKCRPFVAGSFEHDTPLVRPYLLTPEERHERRLQRQRRRALWLAVHGVDVGPRRIHGMEVSA
ncbi:hypothetical protein ACWD0J_22170 [Streptomyces sp. NPDC003011]